MKEKTVDPVYIIMKNMMVKSAIDVKMNTMNIILIAFIVNALQFNILGIFWLLELL